MCVSGSHSLPFACGVCVLCCSLHSYEWEWEPTVGSVRVGWAGSVKQLAGQRASAEVACAAFGVYAIDVVLSASAVEFSDDVCGALVLSETLGESPSLYL